MFGMSQKSEDKIAKLVQKKAWDKIKSKYLYLDSQTQVILAKACEKSKADDCVNIVLELLDKGAEDVQIAALVTLGKIANDHVTSTLRAMYAKTPQENEKLRNTIMSTLQEISGRK